MLNYSKHFFFFKIFLCFIFFSFFFVFSYNNIIFFKFFYKYLLIIILVYLLASTFLVLNKSIKYGKYPSSTQRFWKRTYYLFWIIEFFLFLIFIFITCVHFSESNYFLDWKNIFNIYFDTISNFFFFSIVIHMIIVLTSFKIFFFKYNNLVAVNILFLCSMSLIMLIVFYEFSKFFFSLNFIIDSELFLKSIQFKKNSFLIFSENEILNKTRTLNFYLSLFIILKFWHVIFIYLNYMFFLRNFIFNNKLSVDLASSNIQNFLYLYIFNILSIFFFSKNVLLFLFNFNYYWFFLNLNFTNFFSNLFFEIINLLLW